MNYIPHQLQDAIAGRYLLEREVGRGGMATVYLARDLKHDRPVAVKVLLPALGALLGAERFLREIKTVARLQHPHILALYDSGDANGMLYYVMPFVRGDSLRDRLRRERRLPVRDALWIARNVADALHYAHASDIVHRDIKPENILLSGTHAIVADFGIARAVHVAGGEQWETLTESGVALGTPAYMSPEQTVGESVDGRTDIYSLGCVLFEMLAGAPPFTGPDGQVLLAKRFTDAPPSLCALRDDVPAVLDAAVTKALAREPANRFANALDLTHAIWDEQGTSPRLDVRRPARRRMRRPGVWLMSGGLGAAAVLGGLTFMKAREGARPEASVRQASIAAGVRDTLQVARPPLSATPESTSSAAVKKEVAPPPVPPRRRTAEKRLSEAGPSVTTHGKVPASGVKGDTVVAALRAEALQARTRAVDAGVAVSVLGLGDSLIGAADTSVAVGRRSEAIVDISNATGTWTAAARDRARVAIDSQRAPAPRDSQPARNAPVAPVQPPVPPPAVAPSAAAPPRETTPDARADIRSLFDGYARAIEARSVPAIAQLYPSLTQDQQRDWAQFFNTVRDITVHLSVTRIDISGTTADARVAGTYTYTNTSTRRIEQRPVAFRASLHRDASGWRLRSIQ